MIVALEFSGFPFIRLLDHASMSGLSWLLRGRFALLVILIVVLVTALFKPGLSGGFLLDDFPNIVENRALHVEQFRNIDDVLYAAYSFEPGESSRPLAMVSFAFDFWRSGLDPVAFKTTNLVIHAFTALILALFIRSLLTLAGWPASRAEAGALVLTLIWAIHPLQISSVLYIVQRMQTLVTLFILLAMLSYLQMRKKQIEGAPGRVYGIIAVFFWALAFASKEDGALLPLYMLVLELTVLQFRAERVELSRKIKIFFGSLTLAGAIIFIFVVVPNYWHWDAYPGRNFTSIERLLTQARVLIMYLGQILLPFPGSMPFFYDDIVISKTVFQPPTTLLSLIVLSGLLVWAWCWRYRNPVFSFGVMLFFSGHFITSNVIGLEIAFEHRNQLPMVGIVLAMGSLTFSAIHRWSVPKPFVIGSVLVTFIVLSALTVIRASYWGDQLRLAQYTLKLAPDSERAWAFLCSSHFELSGSEPDSPHLDRAIETCQKGAQRLPGSAILTNNVVIYKTVKGTETQEDWDVFLKRLAEAPMNVQNKGILWVTLTNAEHERYTNETAVLKTIDIITSKATLRPGEYLRVAAYIFNQTHEPIKAFHYLQRAVELSDPDDPAIQKMMGQLITAGREDWVDRLKQVQEKTIKQDKKE